MNKTKCSRCGKKMYTVKKCISNICTACSTLKNKERKKKAKAGKK